MRSEPEGLLIATHMGNVWRIDTATFSRVQCDGAVLVRFERHSEPKVSRTFGPYDEFEMFDGVAYSSPSHVFASLNPDAGNWYCHEDGQYWRAIVVQDKGGEKARKGKTT